MDYISLNRAGIIRFRQIVNENHLHLGCWVCKLNTHSIIKCADDINKEKLIDIVNELVKLRKRNGRLILLGIGGSLANCSHAVNDFRKLCNIRAITPADNISEFSARVNDDGWNSYFVNWMKVSDINKNDVIFVLSVGGGNKQKKISMNIVEAIKFAKSKKILIMGIVGKKDGETFKKGDHIILVNSANKKLITPIVESYQSIILHSIVFHPKLQVNKSKW